MQIFDTDKCVFCPEPFTAKDPGIYPDVHKVHQDDVVKKRLPQKLEILSGKITFQYHISCRSTYTSSLHLKRLAEKRSKQGETPSTSDNSSSVCFTRSHSTESFDWKKNYFLCGLWCFPKKQSSWSMVQ